MNRRRIAVVSYFHPPFPGPGGTRWLAMARHLRERGDTVRIVASAAFGALPDDEELGVVRVGDLKSSPRLRRILRRGSLVAPGGPATVESPAPALLTRVVVPDSHLVSWMPGVFAAVRRLVAAGEVDCVVTSGPPESLHLAGLALGRRRPAWVADFRDGWSFEPLREPFPTAPQRALDLRLERAVARRADRVAAATRPIAEDLERRLGARAAWVPNGWDPATAPAPVDPPPLPAADGRATLVHTGTLSGSWGRDPAPLLRALRDVPEVRLALAGRLTDAEQALIAGAGLGERIVHLGTLSRAQALALQRAADALVLLTSRNAGEATSKLYEYLASGRPVLALAAGNEAARIVAETGAGVTVDPTDVPGIAAALRRVAAGTLHAGGERDLGRYVYPGPAAAMSELIDAALSERRLQSPRS